MPDKPKNEVSGWVGGNILPEIFMVVMGIFQAIAGLSALLNDKWFIVTERNLVAINFTTWGWVHLMLGVIIVATSTAVINGLV